MVLLRFIEDKGKWIEIEKENKQEGDLYLDGKVKGKLDVGKKQIKLDYDVGGLVVGDEGSGKSTKASNIMLYMTNMKFNPIKHIIKSHEDAIHVLKEVPDGSGVMFDEGYLLFYSGDALTKHQKQITKIFSIIRQKNLFFLIVAPSFFRLSTYFALDRTKFMVRVYDVKGQRGFFRYYGRKRKEKLYKMGKAKHNYNAVRPAFSGRFSKCSILDETYKKIKRQTLEQAFKEAEESRKKLRPRDIKLATEKEFVKRNTGKLKNREMAEFLGCSEKKIEVLKSKIGKENHPLGVNLPLIAPNPS